MKKIVFTGKQTAESKYQSQAETVFLEISPETKTCSAGVARMECLQVREIKYAENGVKTQVDKTGRYSIIISMASLITLKSVKIVRVKRFRNCRPCG